MAPIAHDKNYFHYNHFHNTPDYKNKFNLKVWGDPRHTRNNKPSVPPAGGDRRNKIAEVNNPFPLRNTHIVVIGVSTQSNSHAKGTRVASSLEQLVKSLRKDKIGASFNGTFIIKDVGHRTISPNIKTFLYQRKVMMSGVGNKKRLPKSVPHSVRDIERTLLRGGYLHASYVDGAKIG